jgi:hypothetical protein
MDKLNKVYDTAVRLNNRAIRLLSSECYREANSAFSSALSCIREVVNIGDEDWDMRENVDTPMDQGFIVTLALNESISPCCASAFSMYRRLIVLLPHEGVLHQEENIARVSASLLYNMALSHHLQGNCEEANQVKHYSRALKIYAAARTLVGVACIKTEQDRLLMLALVNNEGHIHSCMYQSSDEQRCLAWISCLLNECEEHLSNDGAKVEVDQELLDFHMNVILRHGQRGHAPAA